MKPVRVSCNECNTSLTTSDPVYMVAFMGRHPSCTVLEEDVYTQIVGHVFQEAQQILQGEQ